MNLLHKLVKNNQIVELEKELKKNINPNIKNKHWHTPFYLACLLGHSTIVEFLLKDSCIDINLKVNGETIF